MPNNFGYTDGQNSVAGGNINNLTTSTPLALSNLSTGSFVGTYAPKLAFSLRELGVAGAFPIIRVRKATTNEEIDFYADSSGWISEFSTGTGAYAATQLGAWCSGVNCFVSKWYNQATNSDGSRYVNDYFQNTSANQFKIWDSFAGLQKTLNQNAVCFSTNNNTNVGFDLQTPINTRSFEYRDFSVFLSVDNPNADASFNINNIASTDSVFSNAGQGIYSLNSTTISMVGTFINIHKALEAISVNPLSPLKPNSAFDVHSQNTVSTNTRYVSAYVNNYRISYLNSFTDTDFSPNNSRGLKLLPSGSINISGVRVNEGITHSIPGYDSSVSVGGAPNYVDADLIVSGGNIDNMSNPAYSPTTDYIKTGHTVRLIATSAPSSNPIIGGKTYTYVQIGSYWWLTENLETTTYPNASAISQVTTDAAWAGASSGIYRSYEAIYGKYYNRAAINTIISQGGYTAGGTTWRIPTNVELALGISFLNTTVTKSGISINLASRTLMYQLTDQEYQNAGNIGRWTETQYFQIGYNIADKILMGTKAIPQEFILFDTCKVSTRDEISANLNNAQRKFAPPLPQVVDMFPGARAAYSLRNIRKSITNIPIINIKNLTTSISIDIFADYLGKLNIETINAFCSGATCVVKTWYDQSGRGLNLTQSTDNLAPIIYQSGTVIQINGKPTILFSSGRYLTNSTPVTLGSTASLFAVIDPETNASNATVIEAPGVTLKKYTGSNEWSVVGGTNPLNSLGGEIISYVEEGEAIHYARTSTSTATIEHGVNFKLEKQEQGSLSSIQTFTVGAKANGTESFIGTIKEVILYQNDKSYDRFEIQNELNKYYNIHNDLTTIVSPGEIRPSIRFAYSFRRVNGTYTGPLVRIRRSIDTKETDIFPDINGEISLNSRVSTDITISYTASTPNLGQFLNADGYKLATGSPRYAAYVVKWYDQSLYLEDISNATQAQQPQISNTTDFERVNGKIAATFTASSGHRLYTQTTSTQNIYSPSLGEFPLSCGTIGVIGDLQSQGTNRTILSYTNPSGTATTTGLDYRVNVTTSNLISSAYTNTVNSQHSSFSSGVDTGQQYIFTGTKTITSINTASIGENSTTSATSGTLRNITGKYIILGNTGYSTTSNAFSGKIQEIIHFNNHISGFRRELELETYRYYKTPTYVFDYSTILTESSYASSFAAYSLRVLNSNLINYKGIKLIRVRRSTDNLEVDVFANNFGTLGYDSLISEVTEVTITAGEKGSSLMNNFGEFINGADGFLVTWFDQSGNGIDITQTTAASQPKVYDVNNGIITERSRPAVQFTSANSNNLISGAVSLIGNTCILAVYRTSSNITEYVLHGGGTNPIRFGRNIASTGNRDEAFVSAGIAQANTTQKSRVAFAFYSGAASIINLNNATTITSGTVGNAVNTTQLYIGSSASASNYWTGTIQELIIWNSDISGYSSPVQLKANTYYRAF